MTGVKKVQEINQPPFQALSSYRENKIGGKQASPFKSPELRSFWPAPRIMDSGRFRIVKHAQSAHFGLSANRWPIGFEQNKLRVCTERLSNWNWPESVIYVAGQNDCGSGDENEASFQRRTALEIQRKGDS